MSGKLQIRLLGGFHVTFEGKILTGFFTPRLQLLFSYLTLHSDLPQSRQMLAFQFWPDSGESQARTNLRQLLHHLRSVLPADQNYLLINSQTIRWNSESTYCLDVEKFSLKIQAIYKSQFRTIQFHNGVLPLLRVESECTNEGSQISYKFHLRN
jgi:DNA-binding SARP family transcriptional activator